MHSRAALAELMGRATRAAVASHPSRVTEVESAYAAWREVASARALALFGSHAFLSVAKLHVSDDRLIPLTLPTILLEICKEVVELERRVGGSHATVPADDHPIEACAALAAHIAVAPADDLRLLRDRGLQLSTWMDLCWHWNCAIKDELRAGRSVLRHTYDDAFVRRLEDLRGPITVREYAELCVARERGTEGEALTGLRLPSIATQHLQRLWTRRMVTDNAIAQQVRAEVATLTRAVQTLGRSHG